MTDDCTSALKRLPLDSVSLVLTSPPYNIDKEYEERITLEHYKQTQLRVLQECFRVLKRGGSLCWQIGTSFDANQLVLLDFVIHELIAANPEFHGQLKLRNRIVWSFQHGLHAQRRFSGRYETILWYTKGDDYTFNLDQVRVPQKYPGKRAWKGPRVGQLSGHPLGKNPSDFWAVPSDDIWSIPNVKHNHIEKLNHPCQFPIELCARLILALTNAGEVVLDPFGGVGTTAATALLLGRRAVTIDRVARYSAQARTRIRAAYDGSLRFRESKEILDPSKLAALARIPVQFQAARRAFSLNPSMKNDNQSMDSEENRRAVG